MFEDVNIHKELLKAKWKGQDEAELLVAEATRLLKQDLFREKKILENLRAYERQNELLDEETLEADRIFSLEDIKNICLRYRLRCLNSQHYEPEIPYEALLKIKQLNREHQKELNHFRVIGTAESFRKETGLAKLLLAKTNYDNYYVVHAWGRPFKWQRLLSSWPIRRFENLFLFVIVSTAILTLCLPTGFISLDETVGYFTGFRLAAFFHLLIFNLGVTAYTTFAFNKNFSSSVWNQHSEF